MFRSYDRLEAMYTSSEDSREAGTQEASGRHARVGPSKWPEFRLPAWREGSFIDALAGEMTLRGRCDGRVAVTSGAVASGRYSGSCAVMRCELQRRRSLKTACHCAHSLQAVLLYVQ